jgi:CRISPR/Cas system-associated exonuclease Cas4 (RecB family)
LKKNFEKEIQHKNIYGLLRNIRTEKFYWKELFGIQEEKIIQQELERIKQIKEGTLNPQKAPENKCQHCQYKEKCKN